MKRLRQFLQVLARKAYLQLSQLNSNKKERFNEFLWAISGHQKNIIAQTNVDRFRATVIGSMLLMVGIYATLAWTFFFSTVTTNGWINVLCGLFAGMFILSLDRALICSMSYGKRNVGALIFRFALALLLGVFLSQPIILKLYEPDVKREAAILVDKKNQERKAELDRIYGAELKDLQDKRSYIINQLTQKQQELAQNEQSFKTEMDGSAGTGRWGYNTVSQKKESIYLRNNEEYNQLKSETAPELKRLDGRIDSLQKIINTQLTEFITNSKNQGFLIQAEALQSLIDKDTTHTLRNRYFLLMIILTLVELSALIAKLLLDTNGYGSKVDMAIQKEVQQAITDKEIMLNKLELYKKLTIERESQVIREFFEKTAATSTDKLDGMNGNWAASDDKTYHEMWTEIQEKLMLHNQKEEGELQR
ncbi:MAG: DUF4407 domain-containing protein [Bacteroidota bacterium]|nr:DUF4407 domain-containing protein [Bacteroidota bacterium]